MGDETLYVAGNDQRRYTSITHGRILLNAAESSDARQIHISWRDTSGRNEALTCQTHPLAREVSIGITC